MKSLILCRALLLIAALACVTFLTHCGSTMYGLGLDIDQMSQRMQGTGRPAYQQPRMPSAQQRQPSNASWSYYQ